MNIEINLIMHLFLDWIFLDKKSVCIVSFLKMNRIDPTYVRRYLGRLAGYILFTRCEV